MEGVEGTLERRFKIGEYLGKGISITLATDASPWGIGAWMKIGDTVLEYFSDSFRTTDVLVLKADAGTC